MKVIWTPLAQQRLPEIHDYIARDQPGNANRFVERLLDRGEQIGEQIGEQPRSGRVVPEYQRDTIREIVEGSYRVIYRIRSQQVDVLTVRHSARQLPIRIRSL